MINSILKILTEDLFDRSLVPNSPTSLQTRCPVDAKLPPTGNAGDAELLQTNDQELLPTGDPVDDVCHSFDYPLFRMQKRIGSESVLKITTSQVGEVEFQDLSMQNVRVINPAVSN